MKNDKVKKWLCLILIFGGFFILRNFIPSGLDQAGWDGFLVLFVAVLLWLTEAVRRSCSGSMLLTFSDFLFSSAGDPLIQADLYPPLPRLVGYHKAAPRKRAAAQISGQDPPRQRQRSDSVKSGRSPPSACERCCASAWRTRA